MPAFILDASIALAWILPGQQDSSLWPLYRRARIDGVLVPAIWPMEVGNTLALQCRRGAITSNERQRLLQRLSRVAAATDTAALALDWPAGWCIADRHRLTLYDASYLELALRSELPLATLDRGLATAAKLAGVVVLPAG